MNGTDALLRLTAALDAGGIPYMSVGSYSSNFYGIPRSTVWLPSPEDVIIQKLRWSDRAKRAKDFADAIAVMQVQGKRLDWPYIEEWCRQHGTLDILAEAKAEAAPAWED